MKNSIQIKYFFIGCCFFVFSSVTNIFSANVDTIEVFSTSMKRNIKTVIIKPNCYTEESQMPVLYLLHGYSSSYDRWVNKAPVIKDLADFYRILIVCPDAAYSSWYFDSPLDSAFQFETFISKELVNWIDEQYKTIPYPGGRAITGVSMGGHGSLFLCFRHQDVFGACGSMSGCADIRAFPNNWDISKRLGKLNEFPERWAQHTVMGILHLLTPNHLKIIIDCGTDDFFYKVNEKLHTELLYRNIPHDYISHPGTHNWEYWENAIKYQLLFFNEYFKSYLTDSNKSS